MSIPIDQIICGDNCDVLGTLPRACIDLVVTSPPYDEPGRPQGVERRGQNQ
jgi:DNA modification methylase